MVLLGGASLYRKFDGSITPTGSGAWNELWIGARVHWEMPWIYSQGVSGSNMVGQSMTDAAYWHIRAGICNVAGGPGGTVGCQHALMMEFQSTVQQDYRQVASGSGFRHSMAMGWHNAVVRTGSVLSTSGQGNDIGLDSNGNHYMFIRITTGSSGFDELGINGILLDSTDTTALLTNVSSSKTLADLMSTGSWTALQNYVGSGYTYGGGGAFPCSQSVYGVFDGVFINWTSPTVPMAINEVVTRIIQ